MDDKLIKLGISLTEAAARNTASSIRDKISATKSKKNDKETIQEMEEIINKLISDKHELINISRSFEEEVEAKKISKEDIEYISNKFIPVVKELLETSSNSQEASNLNEIISILKPLISVETFTILQMIGFNFKKGIGEPLTYLLSNYINSNRSSDKELEVENQKLLIEREIQLYKMINDEQSYNRYQELNE